MSQDKPVAAQEPIAQYYINSQELLLVNPLPREAVARTIPLYDHAAPCARCAELVPVEKEDANNYCRILSLLGMEEEGDPIHEIERLLALHEGMVCADCNNTGWLENREEGRYPCTCMTEAEPYQLLEAKITENASSVNYLRLRVEQFDRAISRIGHHLHLTLAGVDTEDEHGPGGHSAEAICRKFDTQAERIKVLEAEREQLNIDLSKFMGQYGQQEKKLAKANSLIEVCHYAIRGSSPKDAAYETALYDIEQYQKGEEA